jgi:hypothetical protein
MTEWFFKKLKLNSRWVILSKSIGEKKYIYLKIIIKYHSICIV